MLTPFFASGMIAPNRQRSFRTAVAAHVALVSALALALLQSPAALPAAGQVLLVAGIVEGATLVGWRLTQLPKSQALEFLLVSPLRPRRLFLAETLVGLSRLALVTLSALPLYLLLYAEGILLPTDLPAVLLMPWTWGAITGLTLVTGARWSASPAWSCTCWSACWPARTCGCG